MTGVRRRPRCCPRERAKCQAAAQTRSANDTNAAATTVASTPASSPSSRHQVSSGAAQFRGVQKLHGCMGACELNISPYLETVLLPSDHTYTQKSISPSFQHNDPLQFCCFFCFFCPVLDWLVQPKPRWLGGNGWLLDGPEEVLQGEYQHS